LIDEWSTVPLALALALALALPKANITRSCFIGALGGTRNRNVCPPLTRSCHVVRSCVFSVWCPWPVILPRSRSAASPSSVSTRPRGGQAGFCHGRFNDHHVGSIEDEPELTGLPR
jgi:hypothetical protein